MRGNESLLQTTFKQGYVCFYCLFVLLFKVMLTSHNNLLKFTTLTQLWKDIFLNHTEVSMCSVPASEQTFICTTSALLFNCCNGWGQRLDNTLVKVFIKHIFFTSLNIHRKIEEPSVFHLPFVVVSLCLLASCVLSFLPQSARFLLLTLVSHLSPLTNHSGVFHIPLSSSLFNQSSFTTSSSLFGFALAFSLCRSSLVLLVCCQTELIFPPNNPPPLNS